MSERETSPTGDSRLPALLTFDFEDWYQLAYRSLGVVDWDARRPPFQRQIRLVLDLLDAIDASATFFVLGLSAARYPELVREVAARGHEVACHGYAHIHVYEQSTATFREDIERASDLIEQTIGRRPLGYRAPWFSINRDALWAYPLLHELGFDYDSSQYDSPLARERLKAMPRNSYRLALPSGGELLEFPVSVSKIVGVTVPVGGGGYWRAIPGPILVRALREAARSSGHLTLYFHPHEFDASPLQLSHAVRPSASWRLRSRYTPLYTNTGRQRIGAQLCAVAREFRFMSCARLRAEIGSSVRASSRALSEDGVVI